MKSPFHKSQRSHDRPTLFPHSRSCYYPSCEEDRIHHALFCAGHELHWRANYTVPSERGTDDERKEFFSTYWKAAEVEALTVLRLAGVPEPKQEVILRKIAASAHEFYSTQQPGDAEHLPVSHQVKDVDNEFIEDRIGSGLANGYRIRARFGSEGATRLASLHAQTAGEIAAEIASATITYEASESDADTDSDHNNEQQQIYIGRHIRRQCSEFAAAGPAPDPKSEPSK